LGVSHSRPTEGKTQSLSRISIKDRRPSDDTNYSHSFGSDSFGGYKKTPSMKKIRKFTEPTTKQEETVDLSLELKKKFLTSRQMQYRERAKLFKQRNTQS
jgi:hypothetical protein